MNGQLRDLLREGAGFTRCREWAEECYLGVNRDLMAIDPELQEILLFWWLSMEFAGGGVELYLRGVCADHHELLLEATARIGASKLHEVLVMAGGLFEGGVVPADRLGRVQIIDGFFAEESCDEWDEKREAIDAKYQKGEEIAGDLLLEDWRRRSVGGGA